MTVELKDIYDTMLSEADLKKQFDSGIVGPLEKIFEKILEEENELRSKNSNYNSLESKQIREAARLAADSVISYKKLVDRSFDYEERKRMLEESKKAQRFLWGSYDKSDQLKDEFKIEELASEIVRLERIYNSKLAETEKDKYIERTKKEPKKVKRLEEFQQEINPKAIYSHQSFNVEELMDLNDSEENVLDPTTSISEDIKNIINKIIAYFKNLFK